MNEPTPDAFCVCLSVVQYVRAKYAPDSVTELVDLLELRCREQREEKERATQEQFRIQEEARQRLERID